MLFFLPPAPKIASPAFRFGSDVTVTVDTAAPGTPISPYVYGTNENGWTAADKYLTLGRMGGNRLTAYNWENNASNAGNDYYFQNDGYLGGGNVPGEVPRSAVAAALAAGKAEIVTVPMAGYVSADKNGDGDVRNSGANYLATRFRVSRAKKGAAFVYPPNLGDASVYQDEFVSWLESKFPSRSAPIFYCLDNEPDLWANTHAEVHPAAPTYDEMVQKTTDLASAIKDVAPAAQVFGFVSYGWYGYRTLQGAPDAAGRDFTDFFLDAMRTAETTGGRRLLDVLDLHWYPEATGGGVRITGSDVTPAVVAARIQAPRSLWDPTYTETSWITQYSTYGPIRLIPRVAAEIAAHYPGTKLAITEYNYGGGGQISGAIAQADALGIFGREGVYAAAMWPLSGDNSFIHAGFDAFRNYDGKGSAFGGISLPATTSSVSDVTVYASRVGNLRDAPRVIVLINKASTSKTVTVSMTSAASAIYAFSLTSAQPRMLATNLGRAAGTVLSLTLPALSVDTIEVRTAKKEERG